MCFLLSHACKGGAYACCICCCRSDIGVRRNYPCGRSLLADCGRKCSVGCPEGQRRSGPAGRAGGIKPSRRKGKTKGGDADGRSGYYPGSSGHHCWRAGGHHRKMMSCRRAVQCLQIPFQFLSGSVKSIGNAGIHIATGVREAWNAQEG